MLFSQFSGKKLGIIGILKTDGEMSTFQIFNFWVFLTYEEMSAFQIFNFWVF